jgi:transcriptional regulator with XRE-family HTH domain
MQRGWVVSSDYRSVIESIKAVRVELGVSQRELARRLGKPSSFINKIELLERRLDIVEFIAVADALGVTSVDLLTRLRAGLPERVAI